MFHSRLFTALLAVISVPALAQSNGSSFDFEALQDRAAEIQENPASHLDSKTIKAIEALDLGDYESALGGVKEDALERIATEGLDELEGFGRFSRARIETTKQLMQERRQAGDATSPLLHGRRATTVVFISSSMPSAQFREALLAVQNTPDTVGVIRGLLPGTTSIPETVLALKMLIDEADLEGVAPSVFIDPTLFSDNAIKTVPTIVHYRGKQPVARLSGLPNAQFMQEQVKDGKSGDLGRFGEVFNIAEVNLIEEMKRRVAQLDSDQIIRDANTSFFDEQPRFPLPVAEKTQRFSVDMSITVNEDIQDNEGGLIVRKGTRFNPLVAIDLQQTILVFNPEIPEQRIWAADQGRASVDNGLRPVYIATHIPTGNEGSEWDKVRQLNESLPGGDMTLLNRSIVSRFQLRRVPSRLTQNGEVMELVEVAINEKGAELP